MKNITVSQVVEMLDRFPGRREDRTDSTSSDSILMTDQTVIHANPYGEFSMVVRADSATPKTETIGLIYKQRTDMYRRVVDRLKRHARITGHVRLVTFVLFLAGFVVGFWDFSNPRVLGLSGAGVALIAFICLVIRHSSIYRKLHRAQVMEEINTEAYARYRREWAQLPCPVVPDEYRQSPTARDLDIFGTSSLMQLVGPIHLPEARIKLAQWFLDPAPISEIALRQKSIAELAPDLDHRQEFAYLSRQSREIHTDSEEFLQWAEGDSLLDDNSPVFGWVRVFLGVELLLIILHATAVISYPVWILMILGNLIFTRIHQSRIHGIFTRVGSKRRLFRGYATLLRLIEGTSYTSSCIMDLKEMCRTGDRNAASALKKLDGLIHLSEVRLSGMLYGFLQGLFLWDFHVLRSMERWRKTNGGSVRRWIDGLAEYEALSSLSTLLHDHPDWVFPDVRDDRSDFVAVQLGHPLLLPDTCVRNDVTVGPPGSFFLVTGSNMSGKSTLLRAIGVNVLLALAGGPVCATSLTLCPVILGTSFRIRDSLADGVSFYMAELLRLKEIIHTVRDEDAPMLLYLFDEILMGTNIVERQSAVRKVIRYLVDKGAIGVLATHDLTIADARELRDACRPVHFTEQFVERDDGDDMVFDYVLRHGVAKSSNALKMLKMVDLVETN